MYTPTNFTIADMVSSEMGPAAREEALEILDVMGPYSIDRLLEAVRAGDVNGLFYGDTKRGDDECEWEVDVDNDYREFYWDDEVEENVYKGRVEDNNFVGCMLGWAGFVENKKIEDLRKAIHKKFQTAFWHKEDTTLNLEKWLEGINTGDTPQTNPKSYVFEQLILAYQNGLRPENYREEVN